MHKTRNLRFSYLLFIIILVGAALRIHRIDQKGFWLDEMLTVLRITSGFIAEDLPKGTPFVPSTRLDAGVTTIPTSQVWGTNPWALSPPLYYFLLKGWIHLAGGSDGAIRLLSALLSVLTILMGFLIGRQLGGTRAGLIMAGLLATSPSNLYYAQENRNYALLILTVLLSYYYLLRLRNEPDGVGLVGYTLATAAAWYTHYFAVLIIPAQALYVILQKDRRFTTRWAIAALTAGLLFLPWIPRLLVEWTYRSKQVWLFQEQSPWKLFLKAITLPCFHAFSSRFFLLFVVFVLCGVVVHRRRPTTAALLGSWMFVPIAALLVLDLVTGSNFIKFTRYTVMINPAVYLLLTLAVIAVAKRWSWVLLCLLLAVNINGIVRYYKEPYKAAQWKEAAAYIQTKVRRGDLVLIYNPPAGHAWALSSSLALLARYLPFQAYPFLLMDDGCQAQALTQMNPWSRLALLTADSKALPNWATDLYTVQDHAYFHLTGTVWILQKPDQGLPKRDIVSPGNK